LCSFFRIIALTRIFYSYAAGVVINTCGWVRGEGYNQIKHIAQAFEVQDNSILFLTLGTIAFFVTLSAGIE
jgi:hypothetical protein